MQEQYTSKDVLKLAVQAKAKGVDLYMMLARNSENYHVSQLFAALAKEEQHHKLELQKWSERIDPTDKGEAYPGERAMFLKSLAAENTFECDEATRKALEKTISEEEALRAGINFEKDFMLFLHELKRTVSNEDENEDEKVIDTLIDQEIEHIREIIKIKDKQ